MITATLDKNWRDECFGELDFDKLEYFLMMAYHVCKDIDSTEWFDHWPDAVRFHIAEAYNLIQEWNKDNITRDNNPSESDAEFSFKAYRIWRYKMLNDILPEAFIIDKGVETPLNMEANNEQ